MLGGCRFISQLWAASAYFQKLFSGSVFLGGGFKYFSFSPLLGEIIKIE